MAMLQQEPSSNPNNDDSSKRPKKDIRNMNGTTTNRQPPPQSTEDDPTTGEDVSQLRTSDSINQPSTVETRLPNHTTTSVPDTTQVSVVADTPHSIRTSNTTTATTTTDQQRHMKLIVRSQYWGRTLRGKTCRSPASLNRAYRTISSQAVLYNTDEYWGCCPHHGKRVLELQECHFQDAMPNQNWDLYSTSNWVSPNYCINDFFLLPQNQHIIDVSQNIILCAWTFIGTCTANRIRDDLDEMLRPWLAENDNIGYRYHHVHIDIMMNEAFDRETPRTRKVNNERARQERQQQQHNRTTVSSTQESSETTDDTTGSSDTPSVTGNPFVQRVSHIHGGPTPPIPHVISNDSSSVFSHSVGSTAMTYHDGYPIEPTSFWSPPAPPGMHPPAPPNMGPTPPIHNSHPGMQWHPGSNHPLTSPVPHHPYQGTWTSPSGMPPPPPPIHGHLQSPPMAHPVMSDLQQYLMYSDPLAAASNHSLGQQQHQYPHHQHYASPSVTPSRNPLQQPNASIAFGVPNGAHVPSEILSSPTSAVSALMPPTPPRPHTNLQPPQFPGNQNESNQGEAESSPNETSPSSEGTIPILEAGIAALSVSTNAETNSGVTTVANNTMVSSTRWSNETSATGSPNGNSEANNKVGRLRLPHSD